MEEKTIELKLYSPLTAEHVGDDLEYDGEMDEFGERTMDGAELLYYADEIGEALAKETLPEEKDRGLMTYYGFSGRLPTVDEKVLSAFPDVEVYDGRLWGVLKCTLKSPLTEAELDTLKEYWRGQASDGFGEGFKQRPIRTDEGELYVHLWQSSSDFRIQTEGELKKERAVRQGGNRRGKAR